MRFKINKLISMIVPKIHNLPRVIYIVWLGNEYIIKK